MKKEYWEIPEPIENPCLSCNTIHCVNICFSRWRWWDATINRIRVKIGMESFDDVAMRKKKEAKTFD